MDCLPATMILNHSVSNNIFNFNSVAYNAVQVCILHINIQKMSHIIQLKGSIYSMSGDALPLQFETAFL